MQRARIALDLMSEAQLWARLDMRLRELDPDWCWEGRQPHQDKLQSWRDARAVQRELQDRAAQGRLSF